MSVASNEALVAHFVEHAAFVLRRLVLYALPVSCVHVVVVN